ncbi:MAG: DNA topology modulation protein [Anaerococcus sp.]|jgi:adenylate kinase family enzyme|nr:DNA topology modulation protein [Peptoniphilaceae bacterium]MDY3054791.1 DNA topology modulation protein [Anaerococcus sp.]
MEKISIIGAGGSGKSTLARELGEILGIEVFYLNKIWWKDPDHHISEEEFIKIQKDIIANNDKFIFDGNYMSSLDLRIEASDTIIFLDFPTSTNLKQSVKKTLTEDNADNKDPDLDHTGKINLKYINWLLKFEKEDRQKILDKLNEIKLEKRVIIIDNKNKKDLFLDSISK